MKSRKVKAYQTHKRVTHRKADLNLEPSDESDSDINPDSFLHDDIEDFDDEKDNQLSTDDELIQQGNDSSEKEEVLPITDDEKDESDEDDSEKDESDDDSEKDESDDDSEKDEEQDLPNREAWGKKKSAYYSADFVDEDRGRTYREADAEAARAEAEEAAAIQKNFASSIKANLNASLFHKYSEESSEEDEKVDITSAIKQEKLKYLKTQTQVLEVSKEFKSAVCEHKKFTTLVHLVEMKKIRSNNLKKYIKTKNGILSLYCLNLSQYMMFASSGKNPEYHPVVKCMLSLKRILEEMKSIDNIVARTIDKILEKERQGKDLEIYSELEMESNVSESATESMPKDSNKTKKEEKKTKRSKRKHIETENERQVIALVNEVKEEVKKRKYESLDQDEEEIHDNKDEPMADAQLENNSDEKRVITYQIAKNKGLVPHRKKEYRNPRVRHRMKYRKANIRRKGQVRGIVKEIKRYTGEPTGININVVKGVKFK